jgi:hypothetical protein
MKVVLLSAFLSLAAATASAADQQLTNEVVADLAALCRPENIQASELPTPLIKQKYRDEFSRVERGCGV